MCSCLKNKCVTENGITINKGTEQQRIVQNITFLFHCVKNCMLNMIQPCYVTNKIVTNIIIL